MLTFHFGLPSKIVRSEGDNDPSINREEIYIETENGYFPCIGWNDMILSAISMWIGNVIRMLDPKYEEQRVTNYFMDGPYSFEIQKTGNDSIVVKFMRRVGELEKEEIPLLNIAFTDYCNALLDLAENIVSDPDFQWYGKEKERINFKQGVIILKRWL